MNTAWITGPGGGGGEEAKLQCTSIHPPDFLAYKIQF